MTHFNITSAVQRHRQEADWVGIKWISEKTTFRAIRNDKPEQNQSIYDRGLRVEVLIDGHFGYASTADFSPQGLEKAFQKAVHQTRQWAKYKIHPFTREQRPLTKGNYRSQVQKSLDSLSVKEITDILRDCTMTMKTSDLLVNRLARAMIIETEIHAASSDGGEQLQSFSMVNLELAAVARSGSENQTRSASFQNQIGAEVFLRHRLLPICENISRQAVELLSAENCPAEKTKLMLAPDQMTLQIHESIGHPLELDRILGDERNYAGWSFIQLEDFGKLQYGSPLMNVTFDPTRFSELASYSFDDSGARATKEHLIKDGVLVRALGSIESQARSGIPGVANFRSSSWNRPPIDRMANINLEAGSTNIKDMVEGLDRGILMQTNRSWSIDDYRNKFQFGCEYAQLIEDGKVKKILKNPNYRGKTLEFWNNLISVANEIETYGSPYCGKGEPSQVIRVGHSSPYCLFKDIDVFGGLT
ncbi:MAG: TldD/PmbA family protein [Bdellovibrionota bacterium]